VRNGACQQDNLIGSAERDGGDRHHDVSILILDGTVEEGALKYYRANMIERRAVEAVYPHSIMVTFNTSALRALLPASLPVFYMYSMRRRLGVKPWFVTTESNSWERRSGRATSLCPAPSAPGPVAWREVNRCHFGRSLRKKKRFHFSEYQPHFVPSRPD
jgi:hypothetical protein